MSADARRSIAIAVTGASGAVYATRTLAALLARGIHVELVVSDYGKRLLHDEIGDDAFHVMEEELDWLEMAVGSEPD